MKRYAVIIGGVVSNVIVGGDDSSAEDFATPGAIVVENADASPGWTYDELSEQFTAAEPLLSPPHSVTPLQMRKALRVAGIKATADAYAETLSEEEREAWEYANEIERDNPFIEGARLALGMSEQERDDLFRLAATL